MTFYRTVIRNAKTRETELITWQSKDFDKCLLEARRLIDKANIDPSQVDLLERNEAGLWESIFPAWNKKEVSNL